jgi:hypothetical protein
MDTITRPKCEDDGTLVVAEQDSMGKFLMCPVCRNAWHADSDEEWQAIFDAQQNDE